jgi:NADPH:quinone reductase
MLQRLCVHDNVPLVNVVRKEAQADTLKALGATYVCNSASPTFVDELIAACVATGGM